MATDGSKGRQLATEIQRIEIECGRLGGGQAFTLPTYNRHGLDMLLIQQLRAVADYLATIQSPMPPASVAVVSRRKKTTVNAVKDG